MTATIYATVTAMIAPALFLTATASLMISTATRIARIVDRIRVLVEMCDRSTLSLAADSVVDCRRLHCRLNSLREPGRFPCWITRRIGVRLCLMAHRTFLGGT
ncbi:MAG: DUF2721 domain-containing protein [Isosphaeraceae bacterium]